MLARGNDCYIEELHRNYSQCNTCTVLGRDTLSQQFFIQNSNCRTVVTYWLCQMALKLETVLDLHQWFFFGFFFLVVVQESGISLEGVLFFATALEDIYFYSGLLLYEYNSPKRQIRLTPCFLIHTCTCVRERCKFSNLILLKLVKNMFLMSRQLVNKCTWVCVNFWSLVHVPTLHFNSMCFFSSLFLTLGV